MSDTVDLQLIQELLAIMDQGGLTELVYEKDEVHIALSRKQDQILSSAPVAGVSTAAPTTPAETPAPQVAEPTEQLPQFLSPMVGTFYSKANPDSEPFVSAGKQVGEEDVICILEAMKVFNEIKAEFSGEIVEILAKDGDNIEFDQPLFTYRSA